MAPPEIYIIQSDGNNLRRMTADERWDTNPVWSPTGKSLVYTTNTLPPMAGGRNKPSTDLFIMNLLNGTKIAIHTPNRDISHPVWSPSGARLAFVTKPLTIPGDADGAEANEHIHLIDADGNNTRQLSPYDRPGALPTWSPDEEWFAFAVLPDLFDRSKNTSSAYMLRTDGTCGEQIVKAAIQTINAVVWSPYDSQIAIILQPPAIDTAKPEVIEPSTVTTTFTIFAANSLQTKVWAEQTAKLIGYAHVGRPTWSPLCALQNTNCQLPEPIAIDEFYPVSEEALDALANRSAIPEPSRPASVGDGVAPPPQTSQQPTEANLHRCLPVAFCLDENFDAIGGVCNRSQTLFTGQVKLIRVSWTPIPEFPNATFKRVCIKPGFYFWKRRNQNFCPHRGSHA